MADEQMNATPAEDTNSSDSEGSGTSSPDEKKEASASELEDCKKKRDEYLAGWQRAKADFINYKREEGERLQEIVRFANEDLVSDLIPVMDSFELGLTTMEKSGGADKGVYMIKSQLEDVLKKRGLTKISAARGDPFDPQIHEAVAEAESDTEEGRVEDEIEAGYRLHGKVIRPARVRVAKKKGSMRTNI